jgi:hypothetical protein
MRCDTGLLGERFGFHAGPRSARRAGAGGPRGVPHDHVLPAARALGADGRRPRRRPARRLESGVRALVRRLRLRPARSAARANNLYPSHRGSSNARTLAISRSRAGAEARSV